MTKLFNLGYQAGPEIAFAKSFERRICRHQPVEADDCIRSIVGIDGENKYRYIVASQNSDLRTTLRRIPAVPLIYINRSVMILEPISPKTTARIEGAERKKVTDSVKEIKEKLGGHGSRKRIIVDENHGLGDNEENDRTMKRQKTHGPRQPNPLSVMKKKNTAPTKEEIDDKMPLSTSARKKNRRLRHKNIDISLFEN